MSNEQNSRPRRLRDLLSPEKKPEADLPQFDEKPKRKRDESFLARLDRQNRLKAAQERLAILEDPQKALAILEAEPEAKLFLKLIDRVLEDYLDNIVFKHFLPRGQVAWPIYRDLGTDNSDFSAVEYKKVHGYGEEAGEVIKQHIKLAWLQTLADQPWKGLAISYPENNRQLDNPFYFIEYALRKDGSKAAEMLMFMVMEEYHFMAQTAGYHIEEMARRFEQKKLADKDNRHSNLGALTYEYQVLSTKARSLAWTASQNAQGVSWESLTAILSQKNQDRAQIREAVARLQDPIWDNPRHHTIAIDNYWSRYDEIPIFNGFNVPVNTPRDASNEPYFSNLILEIAKSNAVDNSELLIHGPVADLVVGSDFPYTWISYNDRDRDNGRNGGTIDERRPIDTHAKYDQIVLRFVIDEQPLYVTVTVPEVQEPAESQDGRSINVTVNDEDYANLEANSFSILDLHQLKLSTPELHAYVTQLVHDYCDQKLGLSLTDPEYRVAYAQRLQALWNVWSLQSADPQFAAAKNFLPTHFGSLDFIEQFRLALPATDKTLPYQGQPNLEAEVAFDPNSPVEPEKSKGLPTEFFDKNRAFLQLLTDGFFGHATTPPTLVCPEVALIADLTRLWFLPEAKFDQAIFEFFKAGVRAENRSIGFYDKILTNSFDLFSRHYLNQLNQLYQNQTEYLERAQQVTTRLNQIQAAARPKI